MISPIRMVLPASKLFAIQMSFVALLLNGGCVGPQFGKTTASQQNTAFDSEWFMKLRLTERESPEYADLSQLDEALVAEGVPIRTDQIENLSSRVMTLELSNRALTRTWMRQTHERLRKLQHPEQYVLPADRASGSIDLPIRHHSTVEGVVSRAVLRDTSGAQVGGAALAPAGSDGALRRGVVSIPPYFRGTLEWVVARLDAKPLCQYPYRYLESTLDRVLGENHGPRAESPYRKDVFTVERFDPVGVRVKGAYELNATFMGRSVLTTSEVFDYRAGVERDFSRELMSEGTLDSASCSGLYDPRSDQATGR